MRRRPLACLGLGLALLALAGPLLAPAALADEQPIPASPEQLDQLRQVLARPEFQTAAGRGALDQLFDPLRVALQRGQRWLIWLISQLLDGGGEAGDLTRWAVALAVVVGAGVVVLRLSRGGLAPEAALAAAGPAGPPRAAAELARALELARAGEPRAALHHHYLALLRRLDERGYLTFDGSLTNAELLPRVATAPHVAAALAPAVETFDTLWYGQSTCSADEYARFASLAERVWAVGEAGSARSAAAEPEPGAGVGRAGR